MENYFIWKFISYGDLFHMEIKIYFIWEVLQLYTLYILEILIFVKVCPPPSILYITLLKTPIYNIPYPVSPSAVYN